MGFTLKTEKSSLIQKLAAFLYLGVIVFLGAAAFQRGWSYYYADRAKKGHSTQELSAALEFDSSNPEIYKVGGLIYLEGKNFSFAAEKLERATGLRKNDYLLWLRLGYAYYKLDDPARARQAYQKAIDLAPAYPASYRFMGGLLLKMGETETAFRRLHRAAKLSADYRREVFHLARKQFAGDEAAIERVLAFEERGIQKELAFYFIKHSMVTEKLKSFLTSDQLSAAEKKEFVKKLLEKKEFLLAREIWATLEDKKQLLNKPGGEWMLDGGFELTAESDEFGFGWQINQNISFARAAIDEEIKEEGDRSVQIQLEGKTEVGNKILSQMVIVNGGEEYNLSFSVLLPELTSAGDLGVTVFDAATDKILGETQLKKRPDKKWSRYQLRFSAPSSQAVIIAFRRLSCPASPCPIFADLYLDNFSLTKAAS